jgi:archaellum component FlaF (FlaF/FlaG flagellin family)
VFVDIQNDGSDLLSPSRADIQVDGHVIAMIPGP